MVVTSEALDQLADTFVSPQFCGSVPWPWSQLGRPRAHH